MPDETKEKGQCKMQETNEESLLMASYSVRILKHEFHNAVGKGM